MTTEDRPTCPACGSDLPAHAPEGLCAKCVVEVMMNFGDEDLLAPTEETLGSIGGYEILGKVAAGGMGVVYRARQERMDRVVALKLVAEGKLASDTEKERFLKEAQAAGELDHPHIVPVYEVGEEDGQYFFSMRLVTGGSLADRFDELAAVTELATTSQATGGFREQQTTLVKLFVKIARAMHYAHSQGILHRDLKPANILIDQHGEPQISDFGLAKRFHEDSQLTVSGQLLGSPAYMAPEQAEGRNDEVSPATDVYAIGVMLYQGLSGRLPFDGDTPMALLQETLTKEPKALRKVQPRVDRDLETITHCCLEKVPSDRFPSAEALAEDLERWLDGRPIEAKPVGPVRRMQKWIRRQPAVAGLVALVFAATATIGTLTWQHRRELTAQQEADYAGDLARAHASLEERDFLAAQRILESVPETMREFTWHWLRKKSHLPYDIIPAPSTGIHALASASGPAQHLYLQGADGEVTHWDPASSSPSILQTAFPLGRPPNFHFHGGGTSLLGQDDAGTLQLAFPGENLVRGRLPLVLVPPDNGFLAASPGSRPSHFILTGGRQGDAVFTLSPPWKRPEKRFELPHDLLAVALSPRSSQNDSDTLHYAAFCYRTKFELWKWEADGLFFRDKVVQRPPSPEALLAFTPNRQLLIECDPSGAVRVRNRRSPSLEVILERQLEPSIRALTALDDDGIHRIAVASDDGDVRLWDLFQTDASHLRQDLTGLSHPCAVAADGGTVIAQRDGQLALIPLEPQSQATLLPLPHNVTRLLAVGILPSAESAAGVVFESSEGGLHWAHLQPGMAPSSPGPLPPELHGPKLAHWVDGPEWIVITDAQQALRFHLETGEMHALRPPSPSLTQKTRIFGPDSALGYLMGPTRILIQPGNGGPERTVDLETDSPVEHFAFTPDARTLAAAHEDGFLRLWQADSGRLLLQLDNHPWEALAFSRAGRTLIAYETTGNVHAWDARHSHPTPSSP